MLVLFLLPCLLNLCPHLPSLFLCTGEKCQLRGGPIRAGVPVQSARRDGPRDGASATRPHAAVRRQGEHRALYGTLLLNHAHSFCLSCAFLFFSLFFLLSIVSLWKGTNFGSCQHLEVVLFRFSALVESQYSQISNLKNSGTKEKQKKKNKLRLNCISD